MALTRVPGYVVDTNSAFTLANLTTTSANLGSISNVRITGGTSGQVVTTDGTGNLSFTTGTTTGKAIAMSIVFGG